MNQNQYVKTLWRFIAGQRSRYLAAFIALILAALLGLLVPLVIRNSIDGIIGDKPIAGPQWILRIIEAMGGRSTLNKHLWSAGLLVFGLSAVSGLFIYLRGRWSALASESIARNLRDHLYDYLQHLTCRYHDHAETGDLVQRCTSDVDTIRLFLSTQIVEFLRSAVMLLAVVPIMLALDWRMTIAATGVLPIIFATSLIFFIRIKRSFKVMDEAEGALTSVIQENLTGIRVVRAFARQAFECEKFGRRNELHRRYHFHMLVVFAYVWALCDLLVLIQIGVVLFVGASLVARGDANGGITVGTLVAFWSYVGMVVWPVRQIGRILSEFGKALVSLERVEVILSAPLETDPETKAIYSDLPQRFAGDIAFENVHFSHREELPVLTGVSFTVERGQTLAILGPSGSGKTTIVNLLLRFFDYDRGAITIDGYELNRVPRKTIRSQIAVVMQEPFLFSKTLRDNIKLGVADADDEQLVESASAASIHEAINRFNDGYDTMLGERGVTLSGGQRLRVALARALIQNPAILVLDDAFSAVDAGTETMILDALKKRRSECTTIVIAHRLATLMHADQIIVIEDGQITQRGSHDQLVGADGLYRQLWQIQAAIEDDVEGKTGAAPVKVPTVPKVGS